MSTDGCFEDVLQQWPLFFIVDCRRQVMGVIDLLFLRTAEYQKKKYFMHNFDNVQHIFIISGTIHLDI